VFQSNKQRELIDLLADHADALNRGAAQGDNTEWLANNDLLANASSVLALLQLAQAVKRVLVPVPPSSLFQAELKVRLQQESEIVKTKRPFPKTIWLGAAVSLVGLGIFLLRRLRVAGDGAVTAV
jgi:hypothetical protein